MAHSSRHSPPTSRSRFSSDRRTTMRGSSTPCKPRQSSRYRRGSAAPSRTAGRRSPRNRCPSRSSPGRRCRMTRSRTDCSRTPRTGNRRRAHRPCRRCSAGKPLRNRRPSPFHSSRRQCTRAAADSSRCRSARSPARSRSRTPPRDTRSRRSRRSGTACSPCRHSRCPYRAARTAPRTPSATLRKVASSSERDTLAPRRSRTPRRHTIDRCMRRSRSRSLCLLNRRSTSRPRRAYRKAGRVPRCRRTSKPRTRARRRVPIRENPSNLKRTRTHPVRPAIGTLALAFLTATYALLAAKAYVAYRITQLVSRGFRKCIAHGRSQVAFIPPAPPSGTCAVLTSPFRVEADAERGERH